MPLKKSTKKLRAKKLTKAYIKSGLNQKKLAKKLGVTRQTINKKIHKPEVQDCLKKYLDSASLRKELISVAQDGLSATKTVVIVGKDKTKIKIITDHYARHKYWHDLMSSTGNLKETGTGPVKIITIGDIIAQIGDMENVPTSKRSKKLD